MKRILALVLAISLVLVGCESNPNDISKFSEKNWKEVISENFGFNIPEPEGWVISGVDNNRTSKVEIAFTLDGDETYASYGEEVFDAILDVCVGKPISGFDGSTLDSFEDAVFGDVVCFEYAMPDYTVEVYYYNNPGNVELTFNKRIKK